MPVRKRYILISLVLAIAAWPRFIVLDAKPQSAEYAQVYATAAHLNHDIDRFDNGGLANELWQALIVQGSRYHDLRYIAGSCAGDRNRPKTLHSYDIAMIKTELGPFGIPLDQANIVCGGRIPLGGTIFSGA